MKLLIEWKNLTEEKKAEIIKDLESQKVKAKEELLSIAGKLERDRNFRYKIFRFILKRIGSHFNTLFEALAQLEILNHKIISNEPFKIELFINDVYFDVAANLPGGFALKRLYSREKTAEKIRKMAEDYGSLSDFRIVE